MRLPYNTLQRTRLERRGCKSWRPTDRVAELGSLGAMRHFVRNITLAVLVLLCSVFIFACRTSTPQTSQVRDDWTGLFLAVTKSFGTSTYYIGSNEQWAYLQTKREESVFTPTYRKVEASRMSLPRTFPFAEGTSYLIQLTNFVGYEKQ